MYRGAQDRWGTPGLTGPARGPAAVRAASVDAVGAVATAAPVSLASDASDAILDGALYLYQGRSMSFKMP